MTDVCVLGLGTIGLPTAVMFASCGDRVVGVDTNAVVRNSVNAGEIGTEEPGLQELLRQVLAAGRLVASDTVLEADAFVVAVPTPLTPDHRPELSNVVEACGMVAARLRPGNLVVVESTVPPGATETAIAGALEVSGLRAGKDFFLAHCPERVLPGAILREIVENSRIVGGIDAESAQRAAQLYGAFVKGDIQVTDASTAEIAKLAENTYRDVNIALANELARVAERAGVDVWRVIELANNHPRVDLHLPGPGVGGHCIPVDPWFLVASAPEEVQLIPASRRINDAQPRLVARRVADMVGHRRGAKVALLGASYKADVADSRETPALDIIDELERAGLTVAVHDPLVRNLAHPLVTLESALTGADIAVLAVNHRAFESMDPEYVGRLMRNRVIFDTRNCLVVEHWKSAGFQVSVLGVGVPPQAMSG